ncbi:hypothetical protein PROFUN_12209 [Planoprotostelium fungivorum]|uniref:CDC20/Fizzy WD40 domain-containing protein n=1 Tax=Planoprotostelium fungivorum TaxID=1890364 RepID=A0A2P6N841_9EUKA|nr:hypothetical protein PROFUN_12209 [Planoprotostelium fungivorum]
MEYSSCRFIPNRSAMNVDISSYSLSKENANPNSVESDEYRNQLDEGLFDGKLKSSKVLAFKNKAPAPRDHINSNTVLYSSSSSKPANKKTVRHIPANPERTLDAPGLVDDYYLNLLDWSSSNVLAIGLGNTAYLWNASTASIVELMTTEGTNNITSVQWTAEGRHLAVGTNDGCVQLWDAESCKSLRTLRGHAARVGALSWNQHVLSSGSRDTNIHHHDVRIQNHLVSSLQFHTQEVCGLKWSDDGLQLASGGNDNIVNIFDVNTSAPKFTFNDHTASVKALAWAPFQRELLATGGGSSDRTIRFWNTNNGQCVNTIDTGSQVSSLQWSKNPACKEIVSGHGFAHNQLSVWKYPSLVKIADLKGHDQRILHMSQSPDGKTIVTGAADETIRFWRIFDVEEPSTRANAKPVAQKSLSANTKLIR